jgi:hypothetical protein
MRWVAWQWNLKMQLPHVGGRMTAETVLTHKKTAYASRGQLCLPCSTVFTSLPIWVHACTHTWPNPCVESVLCRSWGAYTSSPMPESHNLQHHFDDAPRCLFVVLVLPGMLLCWPGCRVIGSGSLLQHTQLKPQPKYYMCHTAAPW